MILKFYLFHDHIFPSVASKIEQQVVLCVFKASATKTYPLLTLPFCKNLDKTFLFVCLRAMVKGRINLCLLLFHDMFISFDYKAEKHCICFQNPPVLPQVYGAMTD